MHHYKTVTAKVDKPLLVSKLVVALFLSLLLLFYSNTVKATVPDSIPSALLGNWVNSATNEWEYGFYKDFAIYQTGFWDYKSVKTGKNEISIELENNAGSVLHIKVQQKDPLLISCNKGKYQPFRLYKNDFQAYPEPDNTPFPAPVLKSDTVVILGYYQNFDKIPGMFKQQFGNKVFSVAYADFVGGKDNRLFTDLDSLGRFIIKFPLLTTQQVFLDWGRLTKIAALAPGERLMIYADVLDIVPRADEDQLSFFTRDKNVLFMGNNARLHNEYSHMPVRISFLSRDELEKEVSGDMEYLRKYEDDFNENIAAIEGYLQKYPTLSKKSVDLSRYIYLYQFAFNLMQHRFSLFGAKRFEFDSPMYMEYVNQKFPFDGSPYYLGGNSFNSFMRDYLDYYIYKSAGQDNKGAGSKEWLDDVINQLIKQGVVPDNERKELFHITTLNAQLQQLWANQDSVAAKKMYDDNKPLFEKINVYLASDPAKAIMTLKVAEGSITNIDTLIQDNNLRELFIAQYFYRKLDNERQSLDSLLMSILIKKVKNNDVLSPVLSLNNTYKQIADKTISYESSLKNTGHLKESNDADALFAELIAPYKGKVIYVDFWGTWCGPCRQQMPYAAELKKTLAGKDVVFMYFANRSPEESWKNMIKEYDIAGENVVHYRLPDNQQAMLERKLGVFSFPTYMLLNKSGEVVDAKAPSPEMKGQLIEKILNLLNE